MSCTGLIGTLILPNSLISIGKNAFYGCKFAGELKFPINLINISDQAFYNCTDLDKFVFTNNISIGNDVFYS